MPSFKRREPARDRQRLATGLRPSPHPSLVPLFSTGLASLDDVLSGSGLPSSCLLAICPALGLAGLASPEHDQQTSLQRQASNASGSDQTIEALRAAEDVVLDLMSYSIAQGLVGQHETLVVGKQASKLVKDRVPAMATSRDYGHSSQQQDEDALTIAFRYAHRPKFKTTVDEPEVGGEAGASATETPEEHLFRAPFDMTKRWSNEEIVAAQGRERGKLRCIDESSYEEAWEAIAKEAERCKRLPSPSALRIHLPCLGGPQQQDGQDASERLAQLSRFLARLRHLVKSLALHDDGPIHTICILTISPDLLLGASLPLATLHISRFVDAQLLVSDFAHHPHLAKAYLGYGGSVFLLKGPSVGFLLPPGESRSVLRGGVAEAGAENDVGWKRRRRGVVLETLHEDVDAGVKDKEAVSQAAGKKQGDDIEDAATGLPSRSTAAPPPETAPRRPARVKFEGLKSLRERGLRVSRPVNVEVERTEEW